MLTPLTFIFPPWVSSPTSLWLVWPSAHKTGTTGMNPRPVCFSCGIFEKKKKSLSSGHKCSPSLWDSEPLLPTAGFLQSCWEFRPAQHLSGWSWRSWQFFFHFTSWQWTLTSPPSTCWHFLVTNMSGKMLYFCSFWLLTAPLCCWIDEPLSVSFCSSSMIVGVVSGLLFGKPAYYLSLLWCCAAIFIFMVSLKSCCSWFIDPFWM